MKVGWPCSNKVYVQTCHRPQTSYSQSQQPTNMLLQNPSSKEEVLPDILTPQPTQTVNKIIPTPHTWLTWHFPGERLTLWQPFIQPMPKWCIFQYLLETLKYPISLNYVAQLFRSYAKETAVAGVHLLYELLLWYTMKPHHTSKSHDHTALYWERSGRKGVSTIWWLKGEPYNSVVYILILVALSSLTLVFRFSVYFSCQKTYSLHVLCYCVMCVFPLIDLIRYVNFATKWAKWHLVIHDHET